MDDHDDDPFHADATPYAMAFLESLARDPVPDPEPAPRVFKTDKLWLMPGDCRVSMARIRECSIDSVVTDPPYHLASITRRFNSGSTAPKDATHARHARGFMGAKWDGGDIAFDPATWAEAYRVLKPGGHLIAFGSTKGYHRLATAIEDAGLEIRDQLAWVYSTAMPAGSLNVGKSIDRHLGAKRERVPSDEHAGGYLRSAGNVRPYMSDDQRTIDSAEPASDEARQWDGWRTILKPCWEPIVLARKPLSEASVAENVLRWGTGALNIDGCRTNGRYPGNVAHDGSQEIQEAFGFYARGCSQFFYSSKADAGNRRSSRHPTVKPVSLMRWLVRMVTPPNGLVLDPFAGSGTTAEAAWREGMRAICCEAEPEYQDDIKIRLCELGAPKIPFRLFVSGVANPPSGALPECG